MPTPDNRLSVTYDPVAGFKVLFQDQEIENLVQANVYWDGQTHFASLVFESPDLDIRGLVPENLAQLMELLDEQS